MKTECGWCASKIVTEETEKMHGAPLCGDCSDLVAGGQGRTPEEIMQGAQIAVWIWLGLIGVIVACAVIGAAA